MTTTVANLIDGALRDYFERMTSPVVATLAADVDADDTSWMVDLSNMDPEDRDAFVEGEPIEAGQELALMRAVSISGTTATITVRRGYLGTTAAAHVSGAIVKPQPAHARKGLFDAIADGIVNLYPSLYRTTSTPLTSASTPVEVPAEVVVPIGFRWQEGGEGWVMTPVHLLTDFPEVDSERAVQFVDVDPGTSGHLVYRGKFARPASEATTLASLGVRDEWARIVTASAVAQQVGGLEMDSTAGAYVTQMLRLEGVPVMTHTRVRDALLQLRRTWLNEARSQLVGESSVSVQMAVDW